MGEKYSKMNINYKENAQFLDANNGLFLSSMFFPEEVISNILLHLSWNDLLISRLVCHTWKRLIDCVVSFEKTKPILFQNEIYSEPVLKPPCNFPFYLSFSIQRGSFGTNLLKNPFGSDYPSFKHWDEIEGSWSVEEEPVGCDSLPEHLPMKSCFVTTFFWCKKSQVINLNQYGLNDKVMDEIQPDIEVSEWFARRWDCGVVYVLEVVLTGANQEVVKTFRVECGIGLEDSQWHKVIIQHDFTCSLRHKCTKVTSYSSRSCCKYGEEINVLFQDAGLHISPLTSVADHMYLLLVTRSKTMGKAYDMFGFTTQGVILNFGLATMVARWLEDL